MTFFLNEIIADEDVRAALQTHPELQAEAKAIAAALLRGDPVPAPASGLLPLFVLGELAQPALEAYLAQGASRETAIATLRDVNVWIANHREVHDSIGVMEFRWLLNHYLQARLFRLGRLQFCLVQSEPGIPGEYAIETHIPQGEPLRLEDCLASFALARDFFAAHFPQYAPQCFQCHSWLLCPELTQVLDEQSNIVQFMRLWTKIPCKPDNSAQAMQRVFGFRFAPENLPDAPERTSLQRRMKHYLLNGGTLNAGLGYLPLTDL